MSGTLLFWKILELYRWVSSQTAGTISALKYVWSCVSRVISNRLTMPLLSALLGEAGLTVRWSSATADGEEGVFLCSVEE